MRTFGFGSVDIQACGEPVKEAFMLWFQGQRRRLVLCEAQSHALIVWSMLLC